MIAWVLWEDQRSGGNRFGPHDLLLACIADSCSSDIWLLEPMVQAIPKRGKEKVLAALKRDLKRLNNAGPVCAVIDRDQAHRLWGATEKIARCRTHLIERIKKDAPGEYELVFLEDNVETLVEACCKILHEPVPIRKRPDDRDRLCQKVASLDSAIRRQLLAEVPSFERLVKRVVSLMTRRGMISPNLDSR